MVGVARARAELDMPKLVSMAKGAKTRAEVAVARGFRARAEVAVAMVAKTASIVWGTWTRAMVRMAGTSAEVALLAAASSMVGDLSMFGEPKPCTQMALAMVAGPTSMVCDP